MGIILKLQEVVAKAVEQEFGAKVDPKTVLINETRKEFEGDFTVVVFPFTKIAKMAPPQIGAQLGALIKNEISEIESYNVVQGFVNFKLTDSFWIDFLHKESNNDNFGSGSSTGEKVMIEFSSPNTNKPLHLGHIRNILLGWSTSKILEAAGNEVVRVQIVNDRGIAICKSMLAWQKWGEGVTPDTKGQKGDHLVGQFYVLFETKFKAEYAAWQQSEEGQFVCAEKAGKDDANTFFNKYKQTYFNEYSKLGAEAREMLLKWEAKDADTLWLWQEMNQWVYAGFNQTYEKLGVEFDRLYYESDTYLLGKDMIQKGLEKGVFYKKEDGSVWADLEDAKLDHKVVLRSDGTSVYITQDVGTAHLRYEHFGVNKMVYVVADEQNYHFQTLFEILKRLEEPYADGLYHLNYGMVDLPSGKMKSREGTVVDADDLIAEVIEEAKKASSERGEIEGLDADEIADIHRKVGMAALKFFIIKVSPKRRMTFNPAESVDMQGQTGPYVQNAYVRIKSVLRKAEVDKLDLSLAQSYTSLHEQEKGLLTELFKFPAIIQEAAYNYDPSDVANYCYDLAKNYHRFYHDVSILRAESESAKAFRIELSQMVARTLAFGMDLLGIEMPERM